MRHNKKFNHLGRKSAHRKAMLSNMATSLILNKRIVTTVAKAKALRMYVEPLITRSKEDNTASRRLVFAQLQNKYAVTELFREVSVKIANRPGGYTRIIRLPNVRLGDAADMCMMELVDYNENLLNVEAPKAKGKSTRRGGKKTATPKAEETAPVVEDAAPAAETTPVEPEA
ncbi:50S ribosomal protein L17 [Bacteroides heparinolyticus]|uniref:50S ribosomal protein L17 n=1 Tax=Prevotella heparinolytica TaxID=28113 RepID=UPI0035A0D4E0